MPNNQQQTAVQDWRPVASCAAQFFWRRQFDGEAAVFGASLAITAAYRSGSRTILDVDWHESPLLYDDRREDYRD
jgi:hypothetical protein